MTAVTSLNSSNTSKSVNRVFIRAIEPWRGVDPQSLSEPIGVRPLGARPGTVIIIYHTNPSGLGGAANQILFSQGPREPTKEHN